MEFVFESVGGEKEDMREFGGEDNYYVFGSFLGPNDWNIKGEYAEGDDLGYECFYDGN